MSFPFVDSTRVIVFAHSVGPLEVALALRQVHVSGIVAAETVGRSWFEYTVETARSQEILLDSDYVKVEKVSRLTDKCTFMLEVGKRTPDSIIKGHPDCAGYLPTQGGEKFTYFQDLADIDLASAWRNQNIPLLVTYGSSDPLTSSSESHYLVDMVNTFHPASAQYLEIKGMSHHFDSQPSQAAALRALMQGTDGDYMPEYLAEVIEWIRKLH